MSRVCWDINQACHEALTKSGQMSVHIYINWLIMYIARECVHGSKIHVESD